MKEQVGERELGHFPGDRDLFRRLYDAGKELDLLEYAFRTLQQDRITGTLMAHPGIMERFVEMCDENQYSSILITETEKFLQGLYETKCYMRDLNITLLSENYMLCRLLNIYFEQNPRMFVIQGTIYQPLQLEQRFDAILSIPTFGLKLQDEDEISIRESEGAAVSFLLPILQERGRISVTFPPRMMFQAGTIADWRQEMNSDAPVQSIYTLPDGLFRPYTSVRTYQVEFGKESPREVRIGRLVIKKQRLEIDREEVIPPDQFQLWDNWRIDLLLDEEQEKLRSFQQAAMPKEKLRSMADIFRGKAISKQELKSGKIRVLNISNLEDGEVRLEGLELIDEEERKVKRYEVLPGDLVMTCRGTVIKLAIFPDSEEMVIASANIIVLRFKSKLLAQFVRIFLESPTGMAFIQSFQRGTTVMNLNPSDVGEIEIPTVSEEKQQLLVNQYLGEKQRYKAVMIEANARWEQAKNDIYNALF
ncbi:restriction endonuclease subunit S [Paenibacillus soyae]|uniref:Restriction endonuclease subunit S n=1 Tax=Paenibacillus soyae TaxID=2969249 RepID=A0A9X2SBI8_9BACL|nr:restriction endonuclease subunit S [Paenibacillus soyae]MCR2807724.1 restriction endonuclease subunit S [Paenibacillus soyae]